MGNRHEREGKIKGVVSFLVWVVNGNSAMSANGILVRSCRGGGERPKCAQVWTC